MGLKRYRSKRDFKRTPEPSGNRAPLSKRSPQRLRFVVQKHDASHLHYDFRLEWEGVLKSWAVPKGPSMDPQSKRLAMEVEDHPLDYANFEGRIPEGEYGAGEVIVWDRGFWIPKGSVREALKKGRLEFELRGKKLRGGFILVRTRMEKGRAQWLLMKRRDVAATSEEIGQEVKSVLSGRVLTRDSEGGRHSVSEALRKSGVKSRFGKRIRARAQPRKRASLSFVPPQLATLIEAPPDGDTWFHEIKFDGYRTECLLQEGKSPRLFSRRGLDWSARYSSLAKDLQSLPVTSALFDGEIVVLDQEGRSDFHALLDTLKSGKTAQLVYYVFDLLELDGEDLRGRSLRERKKKLAGILSGAQGRVRYSDHLEGPGQSLFRRLCRMGLEGMISKEPSAAYSSGRSTLWLKSKCILTQELVVAGYTRAAGSRSGFGALILGAYDGQGKLRSVGKVGTGFNARDLNELRKRFRSLETTRAPFKGTKEKDVTWLKPELVAEVRYHGWTRQGLLRQASFRGLREDKTAEEVILDPQRESPEKHPRRKSESALSNPEKVLFPAAGITKVQMRDYLKEVAPLILPHVRDRPLALLRCPSGTGAKCFFKKKLLMQRGSLTSNEKGLHSHPIQDSKGEAAQVIYLEDERGLLSLAQMAAIEIHCWGTHREHWGCPDLVVFDLDPDPEVPWKEVAQAALDIRDLLGKLGLRSFLKVSGGKGYHLHVPIRPDHGWDEIRAFARVVAQAMTESQPGRFVITMSQARRRGKIFIDIFRNGFGATSIAPYSLRAKDQATVAMPIAWEDALKTRPDHFTLERALRHIRRRRRDPWAGYFSHPQRIALFDSFKSGESGVELAQT